MKRGLVLMVALFLVGCCSAERTDFKNHTLYIYNVVVNNEQEGVKLDQYSNYSNIQFEKPTIPKLSIEILKHLTGLVRLEAYNGRVRVLHISPQLESVYFYKTETTEVVIDRTSVYELKRLSLTNLDLTAMPKYLGKLRQLEFLDMESCKLQFVNTDDLNGLMMLEVLDLRKNRISKISSSQNIPVNLPSLQKLFLHSNRLTSINFDHWNAASLERIDLNNNNISMALSLLSAFPALNEVDLSANLLNCPWKDYVFSELKARNAYIHHGEATECNESGRSSDIQWYDNFLELRKLDQEKASKKQVRELEKTVVSTIVSINAMKSELQAGMAKPLEQLQQHQQLIDDLTETLKQHVLAQSSEHSTKVMPTTSVARDDAQLLQRLEKLEDAVKALDFRTARLDKRKTAVSYGGARNQAKTQSAI